ncbi:sigma 54-interacting transcriptional regulator [Puia sp. P3]|uniref:sigma 54-interacting transcriptional regulator n=1 Tax=Puia sp. P3 TaxID=3423952 RepID=UPI003D67B84C
MELVAPTNYSIILYGESGTGKEVIARTIHQNSARKDKPFVAMDCGTLSKELAGSELFGHVKERLHGRSERQGRPASSSPTAAPSSSTRSPTFRSRSRPPSCASSRNANSNASAA